MPLPGDGWEILARTNDSDSNGTALARLQDGRVVGYKINGNKQWISNGGIAGAYTVLANTPSGPSWFIIECHETTIARAGLPSSHVTPSSRWRL